jgi:hypothetical protein
MLDKPGKTYQPLAASKAAVPFEVELTPSLSSHAKSSRKSHMRAKKAASSAISFPKEGRDALIVSLTHVRILPCRLQRRCSTTRSIE